jgi:hypothetical protein
MYPSQRNALLSSLGALEPSGSKFIKFDVTNVKPRLPYHVAFQIHVEYSNYTIKSAVRCFHLRDIPGLLEISRFSNPFQVIEHVDCI